MARQRSRHGAGVDLPRVGRRRAAGEKVPEAFDCGSGVRGAPAHHMGLRRLLISTASFSSFSTTFGDSEILFGLIRPRVAIVVEAEIRPVAGFQFGRAFDLMKRLLSKI